MSDVVQIIIALFGTSGIIYIIVKEWLAWAKRRNESKLTQEEKDEADRRKASIFLQDFGIQRIRELEKSYDELIKQLSDIRRVAEDAEKSYKELKKQFESAVERINELESANAKLKKELDECVGKSVDSPVS